MQLARLDFSRFRRVNPERARAAAWGPTADPTAAVTRKRTAREAGVKTADLLWFAEQLRTTEEAGVPIYRALGMLAKMKGGTSFGRRLEGLQRSIADGATLSGAMAEEKRAWNPTVVALIAAGESSGSFAASFRRAADLLEARVRLRRRLRSALTYPIVVLVVALVLITTLLFFVVPRFEAIYASLGGELPAITLAVISASEQAKYAAAGAGFVALVSALVGLRARSDRTLRRRLHLAKMRLPLVGPLLAKGVQARVAATLSSMLSAGVPLVEAIDFAAATSGSVPHEDDLRRVKASITDGRTFAGALGENVLWPDALVQMVEVGEETGRVVTTMELYAKRSSDEVESSTASLTTLIEPLMMVAIGVIVGVFLLALYLPIIDLGSNIQ